MKTIKAFSQDFQRNAGKIRIEPRADDERTGPGKFFEKINIKAIF